MTVNDESWENNCIVVLPKLTYTAPTISYEKGEGAVKLCWTEVEGVEEYGVAGFIGGKWQLLDHGKGTINVIFPWVQCFAPHFFWLVWLLANLILV